VLKEKKPMIKQRVIRPETAATMREILTQVVERGTGTKAKIPDVMAGGKTGTAQKILPGGKGYSHSAFMSSFVGFAPSDNPRYAMVVVLDEAHPMYYGGVVAAPVFKEVMEAALLTQGAQSHHENAPLPTLEQTVATADLALID
jgi:cell division protein FtsI/penicillin-binding protein 2